VAHGSPKFCRTTRRRCVIMSRFRARSRITYTTCNGMHIVSRSGVKTGPEQSRFLCLTETGGGATSERRGPFPILLMARFASG